VVKDDKAQRIVRRFVHSSDVGRHEGLDRIGQPDIDRDHPEEAWRYAIWESVNAQTFALHGDVAGARAAIAKAQPVIEARFGKAGFHSLMSQQRAHSIEQQAVRSGKSSNSG
jgi:hypothetical protein